MSAINESSTNPLYLTYRFAGPTPALIVPAALISTFGYAGLLLNSFVVGVTVCTKALHGTANCLLALICVFEILHQSGHAIFFVIVASGINFISTSLAARLNLYMIFGLNSSLCGMACAAFDRLFAVVAKYKHRSLNKPVYLSVHLSVCICYGLYICYNVLAYYTYEDPNSPTTGCVSEVLSGPIGEMFFRDTIVLNVICTFFYITLWMVIRFKKGVTKATNERLLKSLVIILVINIGGYAVTLSMYQIIFHLPPGALDPVLGWHIGFISGILLNIGAGCNAIVLYVNSTEYRKAFKMHLGKILHKLGFPAPKQWLKQTAGQLRTTQVHQTNQQLSVLRAAEAWENNNGNENRHGKMMMTVATISRNNNQQPRSN